MQAPPAAYARHGFNVLIDGIFGPQAQGVTRAFQASQGLAVDGIAGPVTWAAAFGQRAPVVHSTTAADPAPVQHTFSAPAPTHQAVASSSSSDMASGVWAALRQCESGGKYSTNTGNGFYGAYRFTQQTRSGLGMSGSPALASPAQQDAATQRLQARSGWGPVASLIGRGGPSLSWHLRPDALTPTSKRRVSRSAQVPGTAEAEGASSSIPGLLRKGLLSYSAALVAIGAVVAFGVLRPSVAVHVAVNRSADLAASRWAGQDARTGAVQPPSSRLAGRPPPSPKVPAAATPPSSTVPAAPSPSPPPLPPTVYVNPLSRIANLQPGRIDQGVDYAGSGPLLALGSGTIRMTTEAGWPGGAFIALQLDNGQFVGRMIYYAENLTPTVSMGQHVNVGDVVGILHDAYPNLEIGWGGGGTGGGTLGNALAQSVGGSEGEVATAQGVSFNQLLVSLGAPGG